MLYLYHRMDNLEKKNIKLTKNAALRKIQSWCAYQERSHYEVKNKLFDWNLYATEVDQILSELISENFLNEERFVNAYISGKFKIKRWGKIKIKQGLKQHRVTEKMLATGLSKIDPDEYIDVLSRLAVKKHASITEKDPFKHKMKLIMYLQGKGYEKDLIFDVLKSNNLYN